MANTSSLYAKFSQLMAARSAELRQILELYLILRKKCDDLLARSAMRAREEGLDLSLQLFLNWDASKISIEKVMVRGVLYLKLLLIIFIMIIMISDNYS